MHCEQPLKKASPSKGELLEKASPSKGERKLTQGAAPKASFRSPKGATLPQNRNRERERGQKTGD